MVRPSWAARLAEIPNCAGEMLWLAWISAEIA
jgi:hypothetical protein